MGAVDGVQVKWLVDGGSSVNMIAYNTWKQIARPDDLESSRHGVVSGIGKQ